MPRKRNVIFALAVLIQVAVILTLYIEPILLISRSRLNISGTVKERVSIVIGSNRVDRIRTLKERTNFGPVDPKSLVGRTDLDLTGTKEDIIKKIYLAALDECDKVYCMLIEDDVVFIYKETMDVLFDNMLSYNNDNNYIFDCSKKGFLRKNYEPNGNGATCRIFSSLNLSLSATTSVLPNPGTMDTNRRPRVVKKAGWFTRMRNAPEDYITRIENDIRALDWDKIQEGVSWPLAVGLNLLFASVKLGYWLDDPLGNVPAVLKYDRSFYQSSSMTPAFSSLLKFLQIILIGISLGNSLWLFRSKKNYKMMQRDPKEPPLSSSVKLVELQQIKLHWSSRFPGRYLYPFIPSFLLGAKPEQRNLQVWEMALWDPSILSRNLFCWFSPAQVLIMTTMDADNFHVFIPLSVAVAAQVHFVVSVYQAYVKDKQILFEEVYKEYNNKFVHPRIFVRKYDKAISTEADSNDLIMETNLEDGTVHYRPAKKLSQYQVMTIPRVPSETKSSSRRIPSTVVPSKATSSSASVSSGTENESDDEDDLQEDSEEVQGELRFGSEDESDGSDDSNDSHE